MELTPEEESAIARTVGGKTVLVTGGGGSIGSAICRAVVPYRPARLVVADIAENSAYFLSRELERSAVPLSVRIASVRDKGRMEQIFREFRPETVFHAAAHKHVPLMEENPGEAVKNNVFGTLHCAACADGFSAETFVLLSTDKAVEPAGVMGATKRVCEMIVQDFSKRSKTRFSAVRFGNVLGSDGSVLPLFERQIAAGGPVTVTHPEAKRYFMSAEDAARLVLLAGAYAKAGEIFVADMGEPVKIADLARACIARAGKTEREIPIVFTGLRPGEKLTEERFAEKEEPKAVLHGKIGAAPPLPFAGDLSRALSRLRRACPYPERVRRILAELTGGASAGPRV